MDGIRSILAGVVTARVNFNDKYEPLRDKRCFTMFHCDKLPPISPGAYLHRIAEYGGFSPSVLVLGLYYIDRIALNDQRFLVTSFNVNRLLITGIMLACKYLEDLKFSLQHFATLGGLSLDELQEQELYMLKLLDFRLSVAPDVLNEYRRKLSEEYIRIDCENDFPRGKCRSLPVGRARQTMRPLQPIIPPYRA